MNEVEDIQIRMIQHYMYCKRRFGLLMIEDQWEDNYKTIEGNIVHSNVDDPFFNEKRKTKTISRSVPIYSDEYGIYGVADYMEFDTSSKGLRVNIVEYKNGKPLANDNKTVNYSDKIQVQAQMLCANEMFKTKTTGQVYYAGIKKKIDVPQSEELINDIKSAVEDMRNIIKEGKTPAKEKDQKCSLCSLIDICIPKVYKKKISIYKNIMHQGEVI